MRHTRRIAKLVQLLSALPCPECGAPPGAARSRDLTTGLRIAEITWRMPYFAGRERPIRIELLTAEARDRSAAVFARVWLLLTDDLRDVLRGLFARCHAPCRTCGALGFTNFDGVSGEEMDFMREVLALALRKVCFPDEQEMPCDNGGHDPAEECPPEDTAERERACLAKPARLSSEERADSES